MPDPKPCGIFDTGNQVQKPLLEDEDHLIVRPYSTVQLRVPSHDQKCGYRNKRDQVVRYCVRLSRPGDSNECRVGHKDAYQAKCVSKNALHLGPFSGIERSEGVRGVTAID